MKNRVDKNYFCNVCIMFATALLLFAAGATTTWASTLHSVAGGECQAYNNAQANSLERSHVRLLNPITNPKDIFVVCSPQRTYGDSTSTGGVYLYVYAFFDGGVVDPIDCYFREFSLYSVHVPGGAKDANNTRNSEVVSIAAPGGRIPKVSSRSVRLSVNTYNYSTNYYTVVCKLPPGTGINGTLSYSY